MFCGSSSGSMATLLQQKNCMTSLSNGTVSGGGSNGTNNPTNEKSRLAHEIVTIPSSDINSVAAAAMPNSVTTTSGGSIIGGDNIACFTSQSLAGHNQQQQNQNSGSFQSFPTNSHYSHHPSNHVQPFTRYFSQFSNQESEFLYMSTEANNSASSFGINSTSISANGTPISLSTATIATNSAYYTNTANSKQNMPLIQEPPTTTPISLSSQNIDSFNNQNDKDIYDIPIKTEVVGQQPTEVEQESEPEIDIVINNVVCSFSVRCHLNLREIALNGFNVEFRRENGMVTMKLRRPYTTASIWSSGRITCTGATSEEQAKIAARRYARCLQKLGFSVRFHNFRVVNVLGTCSMPWAIKIVNFSEKYKREASYEPELHPGVTYKLKYPKATLKIFSTGSITVTAGSVAHVQAAIEHIFPLVYEFRKKRTVEELEILRSKQTTVTEEFTNDDEFVHSPSAKRKRPPGCVENDPNEDIMCVSDYETEEQEGAE